MILEKTVSCGSDMQSAYWTSPRCALLAVIGYFRVMTMQDLNALDLRELFSELVQGEHLDALLRLAIEEDLGERGDVTTEATVDPGRDGVTAIVARQPGILAGTPVLEEIMRKHAPLLEFSWSFKDGDRIDPGDSICEISGPLGQLLPVERVMLNMLGHLSGIATMTAGFVEATGDADVNVCDTRKTTPGLRTLEKYAVRCGGGHLHRVGLFDALLVKENHVGSLSPSDMAQRVQEAAKTTRENGQVRFVEVEVEDLDQLEAVLDVAPGVIDIVLLDNMSPDALRQAVSLRNANAPGVLLEASGGITLESIGTNAETGVDRISVGALTHSAVQIDFGLDLK